jgi:hypothetical protein
MYVSAVESAVLNPDALPEPMRDWRHFRLEYGGHASECLMECYLYLPPNVSAEDLEALFAQDAE